ncbi:hypothetical protein CsSME_00052542 [Camellia sinensis var. sinensis]
MGRTLCCQGQTPPGYLLSPRYGRQRPPPSMEWQTFEALFPVKWRLLLSQTKHKELSQTELNQASARLTPPSLSQTEHEELSQTELSKTSARLTPPSLSQTKHEKLSQTELKLVSARLSEPFKSHPNRTKNTQPD